MISCFKITKSCFVLIKFIEWIKVIFLLTGEKYMSKLHTKQPVFTYSSCGCLQNIAKGFKNSEAGYLNHIFKRIN